MKIIVTAVATIAILASGVALAAPAEADNCLDTVVGPAVCVPGLPPVTPPTTPAATTAAPTTPAAKTPGPAQSTRPSAPTPRQTTPTKAYTAPVASGQAAPTPATTTTPTPPTARPSAKPAVVTVAEAVSFSLLSLLLGGAAVLLVMYLMFHLGRREGERSVNAFIEELLMITRRRKS